MAPIRLSLLGAGRWGKRYIDTIAQTNGVRLVAVASRNAQTAQLVPPDCAICSDWRDAVSGPGIDAVIVATPPSLHEEMTQAAIAARRPVLVEKPFTLSVAAADGLIAAAERAGVLVMVGHTHLFNGGFRELQRQAQAIAPLKRIEAAAGNWGPFRADVSPLWDWAPHDLSMCLALAGETPERAFICATAEDRIDGGLAGNYLIDLEFHGGLSATFQLGNMMQTKQRVIEVGGVGGALQFDDIAARLMLRRDSGETTLSYPAEKPLATLVREFGERVAAGVTSDPSLKIGRDVVALLAACDAQLNASR